MLGFLQKLFGLGRKRESTLSKRMHAWERSRTDKDESEGESVNVEAARRLADLEQRLGLNAGETRKIPGKNTVESVIEQRRREREQSEKTFIDAKALKEEASSKARKPPRSRADREAQPHYIEPQEPPANPWSKKN